MGRPYGQTKWADQMGRPNGQTKWADQMGRPNGQTSELLNLPCFDENN
jgi:hypothetical protein